MRRRAKITRSPSSKARARASDEARLMRIREQAADRGRAGGVRASGRRERHPQPADPGGSPRATSTARQADAGVRPTPARGPSEAVIPVDAFIPGCPIDRDEFVRGGQGAAAGPPPRSRLPAVRRVQAERERLLYSSGGSLPGPGHPRRLRRDLPDLRRRLRGLPRADPQPERRVSMQDCWLEHGLAPEADQSWPSLTHVAGTLLEMMDAMVGQADDGEPVQHDVHHVTRVEGHGNIVVDVRTGN